MLSYNDAWMLLLLSFLVVAPAILLLRKPRAAGRARRWTPIDRALVPPRPAAQPQRGPAAVPSRGLGLQVFLAHPGGPFWRDRDVGAWTIPKGMVNEGEELLAAACREFEEETGHPPARAVSLARQRPPEGRQGRSRLGLGGRCDAVRGDQQQRPHRVASRLGAVDYLS